MKWKTAGTSVIGQLGQADMVYENAGFLP